ncbi:phage tail assembly protein [Sediminispirochaeta bajacaliforniensis]|uniref:phage tail assembly protein n=1 Tax=Sediminispirochaeta bajacaliforniensis TaxID=148 RepID=UPI00037665EA|nr:phage tail assembly protein [Sediminispirochaeta bajacaliforniensis]
MIYRLQTPVSRGERSVKELNFTDEPKVRHLLGMDTQRDGTVAQMLQLVSSLTSESVELLRELTPEDYAHVRQMANEIYSRFIIPQNENEPEDDKSDPSKPTVKRGLPSED